MVVTYRNSLADLLSFQAFTLPRLREARILAMAMLGIFSYLAFANVRYMTASPLVKIIASVLMVLLLFVVSAVGTLILGAIAWIPKLREELTADYRLEVSETGVTEETKHGRHAMAWAGIRKVCRTRRSILIYISGRAAHVVPKRYFRSREEEAAFYSYVTRQHMSKRAA